MCRSDHEYFGRIEFNGTSDTPEDEFTLFGYP
jgi:hypothetical protein